MEFQQVVQKRRMVRAFREESWLQR